MTSRALVLGGGGPVGIGWEAGMIKGLTDEGVHVADADLIVGTSAGAIIGTLVAQGVSPDDLYHNQLLRVGTIDGLQFAPDPEILTEIEKLWTGGADMTEEVCAQVGALAERITSPAEHDWVAIFAAALDSTAWPDRDLRITGVDIASGEQRFWDKDSGVPLERAVAASCALPGWFQPVTVSGEQFMDGGLRSTSSAYLASGYDVVVILAPSGGADTPYDEKTRQLLEQEGDALRAQGSDVVVVLQDAESLAASGPNRMDPAALMPAAKAGVRQGRSLAAQLKDIWSLVEA